jgi:hypothetical protein
MTRVGVAQGRNASKGPLTVVCPARGCDFTAYDPDLRAPAVDALAEHFHACHTYWAPCKRHAYQKPHNCVKCPRCHNFPELVCSCPLCETEGYVVRVEA